MEKYENLGLVGEGSYGMVMKCRNKDSGRIVAIKKFLESDDDKMVKKIAMREIRLLKQLRHENLVNLLEVCKKKKRWYLVFEFVDHTILDDLELFPNGLDYQLVQKYLFQIINGIGFCHSHNIIHRDIKPENILVSQSGIVKLCDFGFARTLAAPGEVYTDYVATRWYRAPELLVGDVKYGKAVDVWAIGCLVTEMFMGEPLFPGDSDIDQLYHIMMCLGNLIPRHQELFYKNPVFAGVRLPEIKETEPLERRYPKLSEVAVDLAKKCLHVDPDKRPFCAELLHHDFFQMDGFAERFSQELQLKVQKDNRNSSLSKKSLNRKKEKDDALGEERKTLVVQDTNADPKIKDPKAFKIKVSKGDGEKTEKVNKASKASCSHDSGTSCTRTVPSASPRVAGSGSVDHTKSPGMAIPPLSHSFSAVAPAVNSGLGTIPGVQSYRVDEKTKKYCIPFVKPNKHSPSGIYNFNVTTPVTNEKNLLQANKKRREYSKTDVHLPELNYNNLPELRALEGVAHNSRLMRKDNKNISESRIPSLAAIDLHAPNTALHQASGSPLSEVLEADLPRVEHQH
ncbi:PREDICTED: cyclin-dependent kinase-like 2 [Condylura cristata]|uniref:cyclin-dependent kinase-like 2 n=1 Tax=Condylura cristata TaxID=143302 RepID=UPI000642AFD4|nr:PREDICTED: cyclin-dependent kinase-like 2 [Condylura cristata]XP_012579715.1 PREDICTED: cyclin-dependent kinase-like 2 [Condylura cristata]XP_012579716.1 PREDICTED: cyclin-dependent kinase-like 2 [Condylura cristata]XP_012579717.1 PREDICTED: cyclin-dependent kinase-like 2 [Condylura cristata]